MEYDLPRGKPGTGSEIRASPRFAACSDTRRYLRRTPLVQRRHNSSSSSGNPTKRGRGYPRPRHGRRRLRTMAPCRFPGNHYWNLSQPVAQLFHPTTARRIRRTRIESQNFHLTPVLRVVIGRQFSSAVFQRAAPNPPEDRGGTVPLGCRTDTHAAPQTPGQAVGRHGDAQCLGGATFFGHNGPSPHLGEGRAALFRPHDLRFHRRPQSRAPLVASRQPGFPHPQIVKPHIASEMAVARASLHCSVPTHHQQVPAIVIAALHMPAVRGELRSPHGPIRQINTAPHSLHFTKQARVSVAVVVAPRKRFGDEAACRGQQDQFTVTAVAKTLQKGHQLSSCSNVTLSGENRFNSTARTSVGHWTGPFSRMGAGPNIHPGNRFRMSDNRSRRPSLMLHTLVVPSPTYIFQPFANIL